MGYKAAVPWAAEQTKQNSATEVGPAHSVAPPLSVHALDSLLTLIPSIKQTKNYLDAENLINLWSDKSAQSGQ